MELSLAIILPIILVLSFLIGSLPTAYLMGRLRKGIDIRNIGSQNMGAMNVFYNIGLVEGLTVLAIDIIKGALAVYIAGLLGQSFTSMLTGSLSMPLLLQLLAGLAVVLGHNFSIFLRFRGGKGGATTIGVLVFLILPWSVPVYLGLFLLLLVLTRVPTISYGIAFICFPFLAWFTKDHSLPLVIFSLALLLLPGLMYIPRLKQMRESAGSWRKVFLRKSIKDRF